MMRLTVFEILAA